MLGIQRLGIQYVAQWYLEAAEIWNWTTDLPRSGWLCCSAELIKTWHVYLNIPIRFKHFFLPLWKDTLQFSEVTSQTHYIAQAERYDTKWVWIFNHIHINHNQIHIAALIISRTSENVITLQISRIQISG